MKELKQLLIASFLFILIFPSVVLSQTSESKVYVLELNYNKGALSLIDVRLKVGFPPETVNQLTFAWRADVISIQNELLFNFTFDIPNTFLQVPPLEGQPAGEPITLEDVNFTLIIPYFPNAKSINIYNSDNKLALSIDVSRFASPSGLPFNPIYTVIMVVVIVGSVAEIFLMKKKSHKKHIKTETYHEKHRALPKKSFLHK